MPCADCSHVLGCSEMFAAEVQHWVLIVQLIMKESYEVQPYSCQWISEVNLPFLCSNGVFFFPPSDLKIIIKQAKRKWIFQLFHFSLELILFYFPRTENPKLCLKSQMADAKSQLRYILPYILGALDFMYCLFILNNTLTLSLKVEEYAYIIYTFWFCQIISHFMLSERLTTQSSQ